MSISDDLLLIVTLSAALGCGRVVGLANSPIRLEMAKNLTVCYGEYSPQVAEQSRTQRVIGTGWSGEIPGKPDRAVRLMDCSAT